MYQWRVTDGEVFEADPRCYLIVYDAVSDCGEQAESDDFQKFHFRFLAITLSGGDELIGMVGFIGDGPEAELSYMVSPSHWGQGYATEAASRLVTYIFAETQFAAVTARAMVSNPASEAVLRKVGLRWVREGDVELPLRGGVFPTSFWRLDRTDFR